MFIVTLGVGPLARSLRESEERVRQREVDVANLAELNQFIVQHLRESILVVDANDTHPPDQRIGRAAAARREPVAAGHAARRSLAAPAVPAGHVAPALVRLAAEHADACSPPTAAA